MAGPGREEYEADRKADAIEREEVAVERRRDPGPSGSEYDRDQREMALRRKLTSGILAGVLLLALLNIYGTFVQQPHLREQEDERILNSARENCEVAFEPMRATLIGLIEDQIASSDRIPRSFFPDVPPEQFDALLERQQSDRRMTIAELQAIPSCEERFPT